MAEQLDYLTEVRKGMLQDLENMRALVNTLTPDSTVIETFDYDGFEIVIEKTAKCYGIFADGELVGSMQKFGLFFESKNGRDRNAKRAARYVLTAYFS